MVLELKLMADVGLVGPPNAGKSTLLSRISAARPKIADYPFTTLTPNLGVVDLGAGETLVVADIPGLIEGAHRGVGMGIEFLKHIERTAVLLFLVDLAQGAQAAVEDFRMAVGELARYSSRLLEKPWLLAFNKLDAAPAGALEEAMALMEEDTTPLKMEQDRPCGPLFAISAVTGQGVDQLLECAAALVKAQRGGEGRSRGDEVGL